MERYTIQEKGLLTGCFQAPNHIAAVARALRLIKAKPKLTENICVTYTPDKGNAEMILKKSGSIIGLNCRQSGGEFLPLIINLN